MKSAILYGPHDLRMEERAIQPPNDDEMVIKMAFCGICGTDVHIYHGDEGSAEVQPPVILGHEMSGFVYEIGRGVTGFKPGDPIVIDPNMYCGACHYCRSGQAHFCSVMKAVGVTRDGGFADYCTLPAKTAIKVPMSMPLDVGAFAEPVACCLHGIDMCNIRAGNQGLIIGAGTIGLIMIQLAKLSGVSRLTVIEPNAHKRKLSEQLGADSTFASEMDYWAYARNADTHRADTVIECAGKPETVSFAINAATKGATVMLFGLTPPKAAIEILPFEIFKRELRITSSFVNPLTQSRAIELLLANKINVSSLIEERIPLEMLEDALSSSTYRSKTKVMVDFQRNF